MDQKYKIIWAAVAENDLIEIIDFIAINNPSSASEITNKIKQKVSSLYTSPERGRIVPELQNQGILTYRELIVPPWRIIYRIFSKDVYVLSVLDSRRNVEDILLKRLVNLK